MSVLQGVVGPVHVAAGASPVARMGSDSELIVSQARAMRYEQVVRGNVYSLALTAATTGVAAGNIVAAAAAASTNFALFNPVGSGKNLVLLDFAVLMISGTIGAGGLWHGVYTAIPSANIANTAIVSNLLGASPSSCAKGITSAAGAALTGGAAPTVVCMADLQATAGTLASLNPGRAVEKLDGKLIIAPGFGWAPLWMAAGTSLLCGYSITWEEVAAL